jgi:hypothetical protein
MSTISKPFTPYPSTQASYLSQRNGGTFTPQALKELKLLAEKQEDLFRKQVPNVLSTPLFQPPHFSDRLKNAINPPLNFALEEKTIQGQIASAQSKLADTDEKIKNTEKYLAPPEDTKANRGFLGLWPAKKPQEPDPFETEKRQELDRYQNYKDGLLAEIEELRVQRSKEDLNDFHTTPAFQQGVQHFEGATPKTWLGKLIQYVEKNTPEGMIKVTPPDEGTPSKYNWWVTIEHEDKTVGQILTLPTPFRLQEEINSIKQQEYPNPETQDILLYKDMIDFAYRKPTGDVIKNLNSRKPRDIKTR